MNQKTVMLAVQGEGRGHLTQAIAVQDILRRHGLEVCCVVVGSRSGKEIPAFFTGQFTAPIVPVRSPYFETDGKNKSILMGKTLLHNLTDITNYRNSLRIIHRLVGYHKPDMIINFYEPLIGLYSLMYKHHCKVIALAHQYIYLHPRFEFPIERKAEQIMIRQYTKLTAARAHRILALSFYDLDPNGIGKLQIAPPILRKEVLSQKPTKEDFILVYLLNSGYMQEIMNWHQAHPDIRIHCFTDSPEVKKQKSGEWKVDANLSFHALHDLKFISMMASCRALASTAGFESVCEAMYLGKPVLMVPVGGHFEQYCNARDARKSGAGMFADSFDLDKLIHFLPLHANRTDNYRAWVRSAEQYLVQTIRSLYPEEYPPGERPAPDLLRKTG